MDMILLLKLPLSSPLVPPARSHICVQSTGMLHVLRLLYCQIRTTTTKVYSYSLGNQPAGDIINPTVGCHCFLRRPHLPSQICMEGWMLNYIAIGDRGVQCESKKEPPLCN